MAIGRISGHVLRRNPHAFFDRTAFVWPCCLPLDPCEKLPHDGKLATSSGVYSFIRATI